ncbi:hypothetical protein HPB48_003985 [Haemaphysalis longicornis]|uniref:Uncharacterized protein n=1 Tax=Haemaphysalis longicornis TaxID=44386 RepID=A0A9J6G8K3_HAELO|nr:hypothetical protein HPB48_003985 [Haemaphysalis longicornis]
MAAAGIGLMCSPEESSLLPVHQPKWHPHPIHINICQQPIPTVKKAKILGFHIHTNGKGDADVIRQGNQLLQLSRRIANRHSGLKEADLQLYDALITSLIRYAIPYFTLTKKQHEKLNALLKQSIQARHGSPDEHLQHAHREHRTLRNTRKHRSSTQAQPTS